MGWALEKCIRTGLERHQKQQQQQQQRKHDFRLSSVELVCTILNCLVIHLGKYDDGDDVLVLHASPPPSS